MLPHHDESPDAESVTSITRGATVFDAAGEKIGVVREVQLQEGCVVVRRRRLFPEDIAVPLRVIARIGSDGVYLDLYKEEVLNHDWGAPPVSAARPEAEAPLSPMEVASDAPPFEKAAGEKGTYKDALPSQPDREGAVDAEEPRRPGTKT